jgi:outer membrane protein assembly factor BamB
LLDVDPGNQLFFLSLDGPNSSICVRAIPDINGDDLDEVVVGNGVTGIENVFALDGASSGPATVVWSFEPMAGADGGAPWGDQSLVPVSDSEGNSYPNLLLGTAWGGRTAYNLDGFNASVLWQFDTYLAPDSGWVYSLAELNDISGDGVKEVAFGTGSKSDSVYVVDGASTGQATVRWQYQAPDVVYSVRNIGDVNGDGDDDVLAAVGGNGDVVVCLDGGTASSTGHVLWEYVPGASTYASGVLPDITGDGVDEALAVLWTSDGSAVRCLNGATGALLWSSTDVSGFGVMVDSLDDVTGDGLSEVIVSSFENAVIVLNGSDGTLVWKTPVGSGDVWTARAIDDLNGDGRQDVVAGSFDYNVYALDGDDGEILWAFDTGNRVYSVYPVGDLDGDGRPEVVAGTQDTNNSVVVHVLDGDSGVDVIFQDGFESGDTSAWSVSIP